MTVVLDGFRKELIGEIGPHEEFVFQVDKLGLEFSESSPRDTLSAINMRQILELLDILAKNQDFTSSRLLYTYLFTRPNTMKRFEFLVESATGDKGLSDVMHSFEPPNTGNVAKATAAQDDYDDRTNNYHSAGDNDNAAEAGHEDIGGDADHADEDVGYEDGARGYGDGSGHDEVEAALEKDVTDHHSHHENMAGGDEGNVEEPEDAGMDSAVGPDGLGDFGTSDAASPVEDNDKNDSKPQNSTLVTTREEGFNGVAAIDESTDGLHEALATSAADNELRLSTGGDYADLIDFSSSVDKTAVENDNLAGDVEHVKHRDTADGISDVIDYDDYDHEEGIADDDAENHGSADHGFDDVQPDHGYRNQQDEDLIDYVTDNKYVFGNNDTRYDESDVDVHDHKTVEENKASGDVELEEDLILTTSPDLLMAASGTDGNTTACLFEKGKTGTTPSVVDLKAQSFVHN
ncbi:hypothetical protein CDD83_2935 [Cordyceps sp. RAO-2017]|nr:hypothetical protein CDD83_2935 [Cordyceps sp. RAO-2017]